MRSSRSDALAAGPMVSLETLEATPLPSLAATPVLVGAAPGPTWRVGFSVGADRHGGPHDGAQERPHFAGAGTGRDHDHRFRFRAGQYPGRGRDIVTWTNLGSGPHTVTADDGSFDSGPLVPGTCFSQPFPTAGLVTYHCALHPADARGRDRHPGPRPESGPWFLSPSRPSSSWLRAWSRGAPPPFPYPRTFLR